MLAEHDRLGFGLGVHDLDLCDPFGEIEGRLHRLGQPSVDAVLEHEAVDDHLDGVLLVAFEVELVDVGQLDLLAVDDRSAEPLPGEVFQQRVVGALAATHDGRQDLEPGAGLELQDPVDDLLGRLTNQTLTCLGVVRHADPSEQQAQVVVDLGDGPDCRARVPRRSLLVDRDRR